MGSGRDGLWLFGRKRDQNANRPIVFHQILLGDPLDIFRRDGTNPFEELIHTAPAGSNRFCLAQEHGLPKV